MKTVLSLWLLFGCLTLAQAAPLAVICTDGQAGQAASTCKALKYDQPAPTDLVRKGSNWADFVLTPFGALLPADTLDNCTTVLVAPTVSPLPFTAADPCKDFAVLPASTYVVTSAGSVTVTWDLATTGEPATSVWLYSGVKGTSLGKIKQVPASPAIATLPGYATSGVYTFGIVASNANGDSPMLTTDFTITTPKVPKPPLKPLTLSIKSVTLAP